MKVIVLQSGSAGNCIYVESGKTRLLFDAGIAGVCAQTRLMEYGIDIRTVNALFITHDHCDHTKNVNVYHSRYHIPLWMTRKTHAKVREKGIRVPTEVNFFEAGTRFPFQDVTIEAIRTTHDAAEGVCFVIDDGRKRFGILTDLGSVFSVLSATLETLDGALIESNYDPKMLEEGFYPYDLKKRIRSQFGHLSNFECAQLLVAHGKKLKTVILGHISQENNTDACVLDTHRKILGKNFKCILANYYTSIAPVEV